MKFAPPLPAKINASRALTTTEHKEASTGYEHAQTIGLLALPPQKGLAPHQATQQADRPNPSQHRLTVLGSRCTYHRLNAEQHKKINKATTSNIPIIGSRELKQCLKPLPKLLFQHIDKSLENITSKSLDLLKVTGNQPKDRLAAD